MPELKNGRQEKFAQLVASGLPGDKAYLEAGYKPKTTKEETIRGLASQVRSSTIVAARIAELQQIIAKRMEDETVFTKVQVLKNIDRGASYSIKDLYHDDGRLKDIHELDDDIARCIVGIEIDDLFEWEDGRKTKVGVVKKYKFEPRAKYVEMQGRHKKLFTDKLEHSGTISLERLVSGSLEEGK